MKDRKSDQFVLPFTEINKSHFSEVGGKGANLGELTMAGFPVPPGFCVTTAAYCRFIGTSSEMEGLLASLDKADPKNLLEISRLGKSIREHIETLEIPEDICTAIRKALHVQGANQPCAVRSSATAEDLPGFSFAGQQDTYLNVRGVEQLLDAVRRCWASLFTDRAITYRVSNGFDHRSVFLSVVVQRMIFPKVSGMMFTADPMTGRRKTVTINAGFGLGEALVSGLVSPDLYRVRSGEIVDKQVCRKNIAIYALPSGGTAAEYLPSELQEAQTLPDDQIYTLARLGESIEEYYGSEQDIEWCWDGSNFFILQSRPITTLYPIPGAADGKLRLYLSLGHVQMMTEAIKPLGLSVLRTMLPIGKDSRRAESSILQEAGSRLFVDVTDFLQYPALRRKLPKILSNADELLSKVIEEYCKRGDFLAAVENKKLPIHMVSIAFPFFCRVIGKILRRRYDHAIMESSVFIENFAANSRKRLEQAAGPSRIDLIQELLPDTLSLAFLRFAPYIGSSVATLRAIEYLCKKWLGDTADLSSISKSPPGNITTEMGLALGDLADVLRQYPEAVEYLKQARDDEFWKGLDSFAGGTEVMPAFENFFRLYGMRGTGEIDITRPRWRETPTQLVPAILNHLKTNQTGRHRLDFLKGKEESEIAAELLLQRLKQTFLGILKALFIGRLIKVHRNVIGLREYPKHMIAQTLDLIKQAILQEASDLVKKGVLTVPEDIFWFSLDEIKILLESRQTNVDLSQRQTKFTRDARLRPPRAITSEGEIIVVKPSVEAPPGALTGIPVSAGIAEGRARVILKLENADMEKGDILVAPYTDPAWTPLFPMTAGIVTEVGGLMTHGAVVAREYGIPAVVGVDNATLRISDGQRIRIDGNGGIVTLVDGH